MRRQATRPEVIRIYERLKDMVKKEEGGFCAYPEGCSDQTVARDLGVSNGAVIGIRQEMFGKLREYRGATGVSTGQLQDALQIIENINGTIAELVRQNRNLHASCELLRVRHNALVSNLSVNRVLDCRHLAIPEKPNGPDVGTHEAGRAAG
jgi:hypothetical protein